MEKAGATTEVPDYEILDFFEEHEFDTVTIEPKTGEVLTLPEGYISEIQPNDGENLEITTHKKHAYAILDTLMDAYTNKRYPYNLDRVRVPQDPRHMPPSLERGTTEHAFFFFNVCYYMRGGVKSNDAVKMLSKVFESNPELFDAATAAELEEAYVNDVMKSVGLGFQKTTGHHWVENAKRLVERYDGDPRNIFRGVDTYAQSQMLIKNDGKGNGFLGFQDKMTSMIIYYLMDEDLIEPFNFPIPVDIHVMRVSVANEMLTFGDAPFGTNFFRPPVLAALRKLYFSYAEDRAINPLRLCDAVWLLSESSCGRHPGNITIEPWGRKNRRGRSTYLIPQVADPNNPEHLKAYAISCNVCPIQDTCKYNIPGTPYYITGNAYIRGERALLPILFQRDFTEKVDILESLGDE